MTPEEKKKYPILWKVMVTCFAIGGAAGLFVAAEYISSKIKTRPANAEQQTIERINPATEGK